MIIFTELYAGLLLTYLLMPVTKHEISTLGELTRMITDGDARMIDFPDAIYEKTTQDNDTNNAVLREFVHAVTVSDGIVHASNTAEALRRMQNENVVSLWSECYLRYTVTCRRDVWDNKFNV